MSGMLARTILSFSWLAQDDIKDPSWLKPITCIHWYWPVIGIGQSEYYCIALMLARTISSMSHLDQDDVQTYLGQNQLQAYIYWYWPVLILWHVFFFMQLFCLGLVLRQS